MRFAMRQTKAGRSLDTRPLSNDEKERINKILLRQGVHEDQLSAHWEQYQHFPPGWVRDMYLSDD